MKRLVKPIIKVAIADDHEIFREGMKLMLSDISHIDFVGEAENGRELLALINQEKPDVVITDIKMPIMDGLEVTKTLSAQNAGTKIIALSMFDDDLLIMEMLDAGARGYLLKNAEKYEVIEAIETVYDDKNYYCKHTSEKLASVIARSREHAKRLKKEAEISEKDREIIRYICQGLTNKEIGQKMFLSSRTVEGYRMKILEKLEVKNIAGIVIEAIRLGIYIPQAAP